MVESLIMRCLPWCLPSWNRWKPIAKRKGFVAVSNDGKRGTFEEDLQRCISRGRRNTRDTLVRCVRRSGRIFLEKGCILEHEIFRFAKMILRDKYSTSYDLASLFPGRRSSLNKWSGKIAKRIGTRPSPVLSTFHFWRKSRRIASFFSVVNLEHWGGIAELLPFWHCQGQKLRMSRRIAAVFDVAKVKNWGSHAE